MGKKKTQLELAQEELAEEKVKAEEARQEKIKDYLKSRLRELEQVDKNIENKEKELEKYREEQEKKRTEIQEKIDKVVGGDTIAVFSETSTGIGFKRSFNFLDSGSEFYNGYTHYTSGRLGLGNY